MALKIEKTPIESQKEFSKFFLENQRKEIAKNVLELRTKNNEIELNISSLSKQIDKNNLTLLNLIQKRDELSSFIDNEKTSMSNNILNFLNIKTKKNLLKDNILDEIVIVNNSILETEKTIKELKESYENLQNEIKTKDEIKSLINDFYVENEEMYKKYQPIITRLFEKFKSNDFSDKEYFEKIKNDIESLFENDKENQNIRNFLLNYTESLKERGVKNVCKENGILIFHTVNFGTTGVNSNINLDSLNETSRDESTTQKLSTILSLEPTISTSTYNFNEKEDMTYQFGNGLSFIVSDGYIDTATSGDAGTKSESSGIKGSKARFSSPFFKQWGGVFQEEKTEKISLDIKESINPGNKEKNNEKYNELTIQNPKISSFFINPPIFMQKKDIDKDRNSIFSFFNDEEFLEYKNILNGKSENIESRRVVMNKIINHLIEQRRLPSLNIIADIKNNYNIPLLLSIGGNFYFVSKKEDFRMVSCEEILDFKNLELSKEQKEREFNSLFNEKGKFFLNKKQLGLSDRQLEEIEKENRNVNLNDLSL